MALNELLTSELNGIKGCEGAKIRVGASRDVGPGQSNWIDFSCEVPEHLWWDLVTAVAGGVVSCARDRYNVLDA